jgi:hypothetical protein
METLSRDLFLHMAGFLSAADLFTLQCVARDMKLGIDEWRLLASCKFAMVTKSSCNVWSLYPQPVDLMLACGVRVACDRPTTGDDLLRLFYAVSHDDLSAFLTLFRKCPQVLFETYWGMPRTFMFMIRMVYTSEADEKIAYGIHADYKAHDLVRLGLPASLMRNIVQNQITMDRPLKLCKTKKFLMNGSMLIRVAMAKASSVSNIMGYKDVTRPVEIYRFLKANKLLE